MAKRGRKPKSKTDENIEMHVSAKQFSDILYKRMLELRDEDYCIIDRINSDDFKSVFRDALYSYGPNVVLCDRFYFRDCCVKENQPVYTASNEAIDLYREFINFSQTLDETNDNDINKFEEQKQKFEEYKKKLEEMKPEVKDIEIYMYKNNISNTNYYVLPFTTEIPDDVVKTISDKISSFVFNYFLTTRYIIDNKFYVSITTVREEEFIDLIAIINITP